MSTAVGCLSSLSSLCDEPAPKAALGSSQLPRELLQKLLGPCQTVLTTTLRGQGCKAALPKPPFSVSQPMAHLCLSGAFTKVEALKGALLFFHGQGGNHCPCHHRTSIERTEKLEWGCAARYAAKGRAVASCSVLCWHKAAMGRLDG